MATKGYVPFGATDSALNKSFGFNYSRITAQGKPTLVSRGVYFGFSLPIYAADDEELPACECIDPAWDGVTNPVLYLGG